MPIKAFRVSPIRATKPRTGADDRTVFRGANMWIRGSAPDFYAECYSGSENLNETIPTAALTGTISFTANSKNVAGAGTAFLTELHQGQFLLAATEMLVVDRILSDALFTVHRAPQATAAGQTCYRLPVLFEMDKKRGTLLRGNAQEYEQGSIIAVGDGALRINGAVLPGTSLAASRSPKIAVYNPLTGNYSVHTLGLNAPTGITATNVSGGSKGMTPGARGLRFSRGRKVTGKGYGNPSDNIKVTIAAGEKIEVVFPAMDAANGQDIWIVWGTLYESSTTSINPAEGPWYKIGTVEISQISGGAAGGTYALEYLNSEVGRSDLLSFNNDAPTDAEFVQSLIGYPIYVSCQGQGTAAKPNGTSPGPFIVPAKPNNLEAAPLSYPNPVATSPPETILGAVAASGRLNLLTANRLCFAAFTGNPNFPVTIRPFWATGFANPFGLAFVNGMLYGATNSGFTRSVAEGDEGSEEHRFADDVEEISREWNPGHELVRHDPKNEAMCFFYSGAYKNAAGFWVTLVFPYMLRLGAWNPPIVLESDARDMIVSGAATVNGKLEFLAGGRTAAGGVQVDTFRFDTGAGEAINWYLAWNYSDDGLEQNAKVVKGYRVTGKTTSASLGIYGARSNSDIDALPLETGAGAAGSVIVPNKTNVAINKLDKFIVRELLLYTARIGGTWSGSGKKDRVDEVILLVEQGGVRK